MKIAALSQNDAIAIFKNTFFAYVPYAMFCLMPVFALYLRLLYLRSGRRYGEHMLFALHANAFAFLLLGVIQTYRGPGPTLPCWFGCWPTCRWRCSASMVAAS